MGKSGRRFHRTKQKRQVVKGAPQFKSKFADKLSRIMTFFTYDENCSALRMICHDPLYYYQNLGWDALITNGVSHFPYLPWLVVHRIGIAGWNPDNWPAVDQAIEIWKNRWAMEGRHKMTYYLDDLLLKGRDEHPAVWQILDRCDQMVTANEPLREAFGQAGVQIPIRIARTHIDLAGVDDVVVPTMTPPELDKKFRVMWASSGRVGISIIKQLFKKIEKLNDFKDVTFYTVANQAGLVRRELYPFNVDVRYFEIMNIKQFLCLEASTNCLINPMHSDDVVYVAGPEKAQQFIECKSEVKACHAGALKLPLITSPQSNYLHFCRHGKNSLVAKTIDEWIQYLLDLKGDLALRDKLGKSAHRKVKKEYDTKVRAKEYMALFANYEDIKDEEDNSSRSW